MNNSMNPALGALLWAAWFFSVLGYFWWRDTLRPGRFRAFLDAGALLVDVGKPEEYAIGHAPCAVNVPAEEIERRQNELGDHSRAILVYARGAFRSAMSAHRLRSMGFHTVVNVGTLRRWYAVQTSATGESANHRLGYELFGAAPCMFMGALFGVRAGLLGLLAGALAGGVVGASAGMFFDARLSERAARMRRLEERQPAVSTRAIVRQVHVTDVSGNPLPGPGDPHALR